MKVEKTVTSYVLVDEKMKIIEEVLDFTNTLIKKNISINTIKSYLQDLRVFYQWLNISNKEYYEFKPAEIPQLITYIDSKNKKGRVSPATLNRFLATLSSFFNHQELMGNTNISFKIDSGNSNAKYSNESYLKHTNTNWDKSKLSYFRRKETKKIDRKRLYDDTVKTFYEVIDELWKEDDIVFRNKLIFRILYESGLRIGELLHLRINDIDYPDPFENTGNIYLIDREGMDNEDRQLKTGERIVPVSADLLREIDNYILYYRPIKEHVKYLFVSHSKRNNGSALTRSSVESIFRMIKKESGVKAYSCTPHSLRHTHASNLHDLNVDINVIKARLGHKSINTTSKYVTPSLETLTDSYLKYLDLKRNVMNENN